MALKMPANLENSAVATRLEKVSSHSNPREGQYQKNVQTTIQLWSFHMLARYFSKSFKLGFSSTWTKNFQMCKLDLEGRGTRGQIANIHWITEKAREFHKNIYFCFTHYAKAFDCVNHNKLSEIHKEIGIPDYLTCPVRNLNADQKAS